MRENLGEEEKEEEEEESGREGGLSGVWKNEIFVNLERAVEIATRGSSR